MPEHNSPTPQPKDPDAKAQNWEANARDRGAEARDRDAEGRDRDAEGRARNARPRDAYGRPLPHGASGVPTTPDDFVLPPDEALAEAQRLLDADRPFHAHEVLEAVWKAAPESERELWRGLAQVAVGITHLRRGNPRGAQALLSRAADRLDAYADATHAYIAQGNATHANIPQGNATHANIPQGNATHADVARGDVTHGIDVPRLTSDIRALAEELPLDTTIRLRLIRQTL